ncbi:hypothetical protein, partial [Parageobacillus thermoglucosidasius]|uniref:hypothetical protein n=1 Tax=Parageobacillus thermoglucosidasius TaxID=1426 RepID=UPI00242CEE30
ANVSCFLILSANIVHRPNMLTKTVCIAQYGHQIPFIEKSAEMICRGIVPSLDNSLRLLPNA